MLRRDSLANWRFPWNTPVFQCVRNDSWKDTFLSRRTIVQAQKTSPSVDHPFFSFFFSKRFRAPLLSKMITQSRTTFQATWSASRPSSTMKVISCLAVSVVALAAKAAAQGCCSQNYKDCITWCGSTKAECNNCGDKVWLPDGALSLCSARWSECTNNLQSCCDGLSCQGNM